MPEIIIRGAGIAGQVLHRELLCSGIRSTLLDLKRFPREKVCGGLLQNDSWEYLNSRFKLPEPRWVYRMSHFWRTKKISGYEPRKPMAFLPRIVLDSALDNENKSQLENSSRSGDSITILASGIPRNCGEWIGFQAEAETELTSHDLQMHYGRGIYLGVIPLGLGRGHVAFIVKKDFFKGLPDLKEKVSSEFDIKFLGELKGTGQINYDFFSDEMAVGDAKMTTHPFLGFGMKHAILSARLCAEHIRTGKITEYPKAHARMFRKYLLASRLGGRIFDSPFQDLLRPFFQWPYLFRHTYKWIHGVSL